MSLGTDISLQNRLVEGDGLLLKMAEHFDNFLMDAQLANPAVWRDRIAKGTYPLFNGLDAKTNIFRGTLGPQQGLADWTKIEASRKAVGQTPGNDNCSWHPQTYSWAVDTVTFGGLRTSWRSPVFCVNDLKYADLAKQQLALIIKAGSRVTDDVREVFAREQYVYTAVQAGKAVIFADGGLDYLDNANVRFSYNPFLKDSDGDTYLTFPATMLPKISALNWTYLDYIRTYMADQCPDAAIGMDSGMPVFGLMIDLMDFEKMVLNDTNLREDFRFARPQQLISGFNLGFKVYRGLALMHDARQMRFKVSTINTSGDAVCKRVVARRAVRPGTIGLIPETNPDFITAEIGLGVIFMNDVMQILVPPTVASLGSGMSFGPAPGFNGEWTWINEYDKVENPLKETGFFFARFEYFLKPLIYSNEATVFLYRRCPHAISTGCAVEVADDVGVGAISPVTTPVAGDFSATLRTVVLTLAKKLAGGVGDAVTIKKDDGNSFAANIADSSNAPTYTFAWANGATNAPSAVTDMNDTAIVTVTVA